MVGGQSPVIVFVLMITSHILLGNKALNQRVPSIAILGVILVIVILGVIFF